MKKTNKQCQYHENLFFKNILAFGYKIGGTHCKVIKIMS